MPIPSGSQWTNKEWKVPATQEVSPLFDDSQFAVERPPSLDKWLQDPDVAYHGTFRSDWTSGPVTHFGTLEQASDRARSVMNHIKLSTFNRASYFDPSVSDADDINWDEEGEEVHEGRIHARKINKADISDFGPQVTNIIKYSHPSGRDPLGVSDSEANVIDAAYRLHRGDEEWEVPQSVKGSINTREEIPQSRIDLNRGEPAGWDVARMKRRNPDTARIAVRGVRLMEKGKAIPYHNAGEGDTSAHDNISYLAPSHGISGTYENMILSHPGATSGEKELARQRISKGLDGTVEPSSPKATRKFTQGDLFNQNPVLRNVSNEITQDGLEETSKNWNTPRIKFRLVDGELA
jgi:hypothetical protein